MFSVRPKLMPSLSGSRNTIKHKRCTWNQPDARVIYNRKYKRWTVNILPQCHVKTFRTKQDAENYATAKKAELAQTSDVHAEDPTMEV